jgi:carbon-monoxide dehydrogenase medium subunit
VKPAPFEYVAPRSLEDALGELAHRAERGDDAKILAGGQSLIPVLNFRLAQPAVLVDINGLAELDFVEERPDGGLCLGALARQRTIERSALVRQRSPLLSEALPFVAHPQIRNRGTLGGSLAHADPAAELPAAAVALDADLRLLSRRGERRVAAREFFAGLFATALEPDELIAEVELPPAPARTGWAFVEIARRHGDYALCGVAARVTLDDALRCATAKLVLLSVGDGPTEARRAAAALAGGDLGSDAIRAAAELAARAEIDPAGDLHASAAFKRRLARVLCERALAIATARAREAA